MNILHLVLYSNDLNYDDMYKSTRTYYHLFNNVKTYYYKYDENIINDYEIKNDIILLRGKEKSIVSVDKTMKALNMFDCNLFDYVVRSNISTIVNFDLLINYLSNSKNTNTHVVEYGGGHIFNLTWTDPNYGIHDNTFFGTNYVSGTCIILSKNICQYLKSNIEKIHNHIVDDLAIGVFLKDIPITDIGNFYIVCNLYGNYQNIKQIMNNIIFYRNRNYSRELDAQQIREIIRLLIHNKMTEQKIYKKDTENQKKLLFGNFVTRINI